MPICKTCKKSYPQQRKELGYNVCVDCSTEEGWSCSSLTYHKTGNTIQIIKDPEAAYNLNQMASRKSFGVMKGITGQYKRYVKDSNEPKKELKVEDKTGQVYSSNRRVKGTINGITVDFEKQGTEAMNILESKGLEASISWIKAEYKEQRLSQEDFVKLVQMIKLITDK